MTKRLLVLIGSTLALGLLLGTPAFHFGGPIALGYCVTAALICLVPAAVTLVVAELAARVKPDYLALAFLGGALLRMFVVVLVTFVLLSRVDYYREEDGFVLWVCGFYMFVLLLETALIAAGQKARQATV